MHGEEFLAMCGSQNEGKGGSRGEMEKAEIERWRGSDLCVWGSHLMNTGTFRIDFVRNKSEVLVKVVKVEHAVGLVMLHGCR